MKQSAIFFTLIMIVTMRSALGQVMGTLSTDGVTSGVVVYHEEVKDSSEVAGRIRELSGSTLQLRNLTTGKTLDVVAELKGDFSSDIVYVIFRDSTIKRMGGDAFGIYIDGQLLASSDGSGEPAEEPIFELDAKPSFDISQPQELDVYWARSFSGTKLGSFDGSAQAEVRGNFTSKPDSGSPNRVQWDLAYRVIYAEAGPFKYFGLSGRAGGEHPQDFSRTNIVGAAVLSTIVPWTDILAREVKGNRTDPSLGLLVEPAVEYVYNTNPGDTSYIRGAIYGAWEIPIASKEYAELYSAAYFQKGYRPRGYIDLTFAHKLSATIALVVKWIDGEMPPLFLRVADLRVGLRMQ